VNQDDTTTTTCTGNSTCAADGGCTQRWVQVGTTTAIAFTNQYASYLTSAGSYLFMASKGSSMAGFNTATNQFVSTGYPLDQYMANGNQVTLMGATVGTTPYLFGLISGLVDSWSLGATAWTSGSGQNGNYGSAGGIVGGTLYSLGGNATSSFSTPVPPGIPATWTPVAPAPNALTNYNMCSAVDSVHGVIYVFTSNDQSHMYSYTPPPTDKWATIATTGSSPYCYYGYVLPVWKGKIAYAGYSNSGTGIQLFDIATSTWETPIPYPIGNWTFEAVLSPSNGGMYFVGYDGTNTTIFRWNLN
jgi:hypothetical protein